MVASSASMWGWRSRAALLLLLLLGVWLVLTPSHVSAHAFLDHSDPEANAIIPASPDEAQLWFTEPIEPKYSDAELFDASGAPITTPASRMGSDATQLILPLPAGLPKGTYTIQWHNVSAADGHSVSSYVPFTIGSPADIVVPVPPKVTTGTPPAWLNILGRWLSLLGVAGAVGALVCWRWVILPSYGSLPSGLRTGMQRRIRLLAVSAAGVGLVGSLIALLVQVLTSGKAISLTNAVAIVRDTNYGHFWLVRVGLLLALAAIINRSDLWRDLTAHTLWRLELAIAALAFVPFALTSHAAAQPSGQVAAVAADWLHLVATSVWVGGLVALSVVLVMVTRKVKVADRQAIYAAAIPRFSTLAISSIILLALTGLYAAWLEVGNLQALWETAYGQTLLVKLGLLVPLLLLGGINLRVVGPRMRRAASAGTHFGRTVAAEACLGIMVLLVVGLLTSLPTARETLSAQAGKTSFHFFNNGVHAIFQVTPGAVGINRYTADIGLEKGNLSPGTEVLLRISREGDIQGERQITLASDQNGSSGRFGATGSELSVVGTWQLELIVRQPGQADWTTNTPIEIAKTPPEAQVPGPPPRFGGVAAGVGVLLTGIAVLALVAGFRRRKGNRFLTEIGAGLILISIVTMAVTWIPQTANADVPNPIPMSAASVAAGEKSYQSKCVACHGANGRGDGPMAQTLNPPPADLTASHADIHTDGDIYGWIKNGYPGSAMPGFSDQLSETEMWQLVNYIRSLRHPVGNSTP